MRTQKHVIERFSDCLLRFKNNLAVGNFATGENLCCGLVYTSPFLAHSAENKTDQSFMVGVKISYALSQLFSRHGIFIHCPAEISFAHLYRCRGVGGLGRLCPMQNGRIMDKLIK